LGSDVGRDLVVRPPSSDAACSAAVAGALGWIGANLSRFALPNVHGGFGFGESRRSAEEVGSQNDLAGAKALVELAGAATCYVVTTGDRDNAEIRAIAKLVSTALQDRRMFDWSLRSPATLVPLLHLYLSRRLLVGEEPEVRALLQRVVDEGYADYVERPSHRLMEVRMCLDWADFEHSVESWDSLVARSVLARPHMPLSLYLKGHSIYELTHVVMFLTRYGSDPGLVSRFMDADRMSVVLSDLIVAMSQEGHWDLLGEILFSWDCLRLPPAPVYEYGWQALLAVQREDGSFPPPLSTLRRENSADNRTEADRSEEDREFARSYHTTLVVTMAGTCRISRNRDVGRDVIGADVPVPDPRAGTTGSAALRHPQAALAGERARDWIEKAFVGLEGHGSQSVDAACHALLGSWLCDRLTGSRGRPLFPVLAPQVSRFLGEREDQLQGAAVAPALRLMVAALLRSQDVAVEGLDHFLLASAEVLDAAPETQSGERIPYLEKVVLLHAIGLGRRPLLAEFEDVVGVARQTPLTAPSEAVEKLVLYVEAWSGWGTRPVSLPPSEAWLASMLRGLAVHHLRQYDLPTGCRLLRALTHVTSSSLAPDLVRFLFAQQRADGSFGLLGPEEAQLKLLAPELAPDLALYLPVTVQCLWTLAEGCSDWRLFRDLPQVASSVPGATRPSS
jgi:hypothetical protein